MARGGEVAAHVREEGPRVSVRVLAEAGTLLGRQGLEERGGDEDGGVRHRLRFLGYRFAPPLVRRFCLCGDLRREREERGYRGGSFVRCFRIIF